MNLKEYLEAIIECPEGFVDDEKTVSLLEDRYGVYDNWPIYLRHDFEGLISDLEETGKFTRTRRFSENNSLVQYMNFVPGTVRIDIYEKLRFADINTSKLQLTEEQRLHMEKILRGYNLQLMLRPYQKKKMEGISWVRAIAIVISEIGEYAQRENIPICLTETKPREASGKDCSYIIYYP